MKKTIQNSADHIVFLGETSFPYGFGAIQRMILMAKSLLSAKASVTVICRKGVLIKGQFPDIGKQGSFEGIDYVYTSRGIYRPKGFLKRNWFKIEGMLGEFYYLRKLKKNNNLKAAVISCHSVIHAFRYYLFSRVIGFPVVLNFVELASTMKGREGLLTKINDRVYDRHMIKLVDGALPISNKLVDYYKEYAPLKPYLKLPILCDFEKFNLDSTPSDELVYLYCGAASYLELVDFVLNAFDQLEVKDKPVLLELILGGSDSELENVVQRINESKNSKNIRLLTNVDHKEIPKYFTKASALLIPLRPTVQDEARFPHKIGEYLASGKPMITTSFGEIKHYDFIDLQTALIAADYNVSMYAEKMKYILNYPDKAEEIGIRGKRMGQANFDYSKHGQKLLQYFQLFDRG